MGAFFGRPQPVYDPFVADGGQSAGVVFALFLPCSATGYGPTLGEDDVVPVLVWSWLWFGFVFGELRIIAPKNLHIQHLEECFVESANT